MPLRHLEKTTCGICGELNIGKDENNEPEKQVRNFTLTQNYTLTLALVTMRPYVPRVLHPRMGHSRKEANVPSMQGKSRLEAVFLNTVGGRCYAHNQYLAYFSEFTLCTVGSSTGADSWYAGCL